MPTATIDGPPMSLESKREMTKAITDAMEKAYRLPREVFVVVIKENPPENVCVGGEMLCDRLERLKKEKQT